MLHLSELMSSIITCLDCVFIVIFKSFSFKTLYKLDEEEIVFS